MDARFFDFEDLIDWLKYEDVGIKYYFGTIACFQGFDCKNFMGKKNFASI